MKICHGEYISHVEQCQIAPHDKQFVICDLKFAMWSKIAPHEFCCSTDNVCGVCDKYHVWSPLELIGIVLKVNATKLFTSADKRKTSSVNSKKTFFQTKICDGRWGWERHTLQSLKDISD